jgi:hypothetical protein
MGEGDHVCVLCGATGREVCLKAIPGDLRPYLLEKKSEVDKCCPKCYLRGTRNRKNGAHPTGDNGFLWDKATDTVDLGEPMPQEKPKTPEYKSWEPIAAEIRDRIIRYTQISYPGNPFGDVDRFKAHANWAGNGLFDLMAAIAAPLWGNKKTARPVAIIMVIEILAHLIRPHHSYIMWMITSVLAAAGVPDEILRMFSASGIGVDSSHLSAHKQSCEAIRQCLVDARIADMEKPLMFVADDMSGTHKFAKQQATGAVRGYNSVANVILRNLDKLHLNMRVDASPVRLFPRKFTAEDAQFFIERGAELKKKIDYMSVRLPEVEKNSAVLKPYASERDIGLMKPVSMKEVTFMDCYDNKYKSIKGICTVLTAIRDRLAAHLQTNYVLATGDWHTYSNLLRVVWYRPGFENIVPIPGAFHIGLNLQEALYDHFDAILSRLWTAAYPGKKVVAEMPPLTRKSFLDLVCRAWKDTRSRCKRHLKSLAEWPVELVAMLNFFDELVPLSLDVYTFFLMGDYDQYEAILYRAALAFAQFGKIHYVQCLFTFLATVHHWRRNRPDFFDQFRKNFKYLSEEPVEVFNGTVKKWAVKCRTSTLMVRAIRFSSFTADGMREWRLLTTKRCRGRRLCVETNPAITDTVSAEIRRLFSEAVRCKKGAVCVGKSKWASGLFGEISDRCFPLPLQDSRCLHGMPGVKVAKNESCCNGFVTARGLLTCGHVDTGAAICMQCKQIMQDISTVVYGTLHLNAADE